MWRILGFEGVGVALIIAAYALVGGSVRLFDFQQPFDRIALLIHAAIAIPVLASAAVLAFRFCRERRRYARARRRLDEEMSDITQRIRQRFRERFESERRQTIDAERKRIMRDVHDGLGSLLVRAIALTESPDSSAQLREILAVALQDLRLIVNSLSPGDARFQNLLATLRYLHARGRPDADCRYVWSIDELGDLHFSPERSLSVLRILQEALANVEKHSGATEVRVSVSRIGTAQLGVSVDDNGRGLAADRGSGLGLLTMRQRAAELDGRLSIHSSRAGTSVRLVVGIGDPAAEHAAPPFPEQSNGAATAVVTPAEAVTSQPLAAAVSRRGTLTGSHDHHCR